MIALGGGREWVSDKTMILRLDTNIRGMGRRFPPVQASQTVKLGESKLTFFRATNTGPTPVTGRALFNIVPESAGPYFSKLECLCFKNQTLQPGKTADFPFVYVVDPGYAKDPDAQAAGEITPSYTFFPAMVADKAGQPGAGRS